MAQISCLQELVVRDGKETIMVLEKPLGFVVSGEAFFVFYRRPGQTLLRGFQGYIIQSGKDFFLVSFPTELFKVQRRKHPRVSTPLPSSFSMSPARSRRIVHGDVRNVSREGVLLQGDMLGLERGQEISPLTLTLYLKNGKIDPQVAVVSRARVVRLEHEGDELWLASLQFWSQDSDQEAIEQYLEWRSIETVT